MVDVIGRPLTEAEAMLQVGKIPYTVMRTYPTRDFFKIDENCLYIVRQKTINDGTLQLVVAAKMRKEVS
ncbi:MAG: RNA-3-phosphate cyclase [Selenomonadaceae bacterium]